MVQVNVTPTSHTEPRWLSAAKARHKLGVCAKTLRSWDAKNLIRTTRSPTGNRIYDVGSVLISRPDQSVQHSGHNIAYARVSSAKQKTDLERQIQSLTEEFPQHRVVRDIGSGINWRRPGLKTILRYCLEGSLRELVVAHRDRLSRLGFELIEFLIKESGGKLLVLGKGVQGKTGEEFRGESELGEDLLSIIHVFSSGHYGSRKYKRGTSKKKTEKIRHTASERSRSESKEDTNTTDKGSEKDPERLSGNSFATSTTSVLVQTRRRR